MLYHQPIDIPDPLKEKKYIQDKSVRHRKISHTDLTDDFLSLVEKLNVNVNYVQIFYSPPKFTQPIHVDGSIRDNRARLNVIYGGQGSSMIWFDSAVTGKKSSKTIYGDPELTDFLLFNLKECTQIEKGFIIKPTIVNVGQPHRIINPNTDRWCLSIGIGNKVEWRLQYQNLVKLFRPWHLKN